MYHCDTKPMIGDFLTLDGWKLVSNKHLQSKSLHSLVLCNNEHTDQLPLVRHLNPVDGPRKNLQRFGLAWTKLSNITPSRPLAIRNDPSGEGQLEKEDSMEDNEAKELSRGFWIGESLIPKQMNNLGILWRKRVKIWSKEQSPWC